MTDKARLSDRQVALLERVCLRRCTVVFHHYMGSHQPNEDVRIDIEGEPSDFTFRPATVEALRKRGLVRYIHQAHGLSHIKPTRAGLDKFNDIRGSS